METKKFFYLLSCIVLIILSLFAFVACDDNEQEKYYLTVIFVGNNNEDNKSVIINDIENIDYPDVYKEGYELVGWFLDEDLTEEFNLDGVYLDALTSNLSMFAYAKWKICKYQVVFKADDVTLSSQKVEYGKAAIAPQAPEKSGYDFEKWDNDYSFIKNDITINAVYKSRPLSIVYIDQETNALLTELSPNEYNSGEIVTLPIPTKDGYEFNGWFLNKISMYPITEIPAYANGDVTLYARFTELVKHEEFVLPEAKYHFTGIRKFESNGHTYYQPIFPSGPDSSALNYDWSTSDENIATVSQYSSITCKNAGYCVLTGIHKTSKYQINCVIKITVDGALYSTVEEANNYITHIVTFVDEENNVIKAQTVVDGGHALCPIPPEKDGYAFVGWDKDCYNIKEDTTIKALYSNDVSNPYVGKKIAFIGDSISTYQGIIPDGYSCFYPYPTGDTNDFNQTWWMQTINKLGAYLFVNNSYSGSCVAVGATSGTNTDIRLSTTVIQYDKPDIIIIYMGSNDAASSSISESMFRSQYKVMIDKLQLLCPEAEIILMELPLSKLYSNTRQESFNKIINDYALDYNLKVIKSSKVDLKPYLLDSAHPYTSGMTAVSECVVGELVK